MPAAATSSSASEEGDVPGASWEPTVEVTGGATASTPTAAVSYPPVSEPIANTLYDLPAARATGPGSSGHTVLSALAQTLRS